MSKSTIQLPSIQDQSVIAVTSAIFPFRKGGFRMEHQLIQSKHVFHNYGHGSAGVSLAPGSAHLTVKSLNIFFDITKHIEVAVLGAGITGLFTAIQYLKRGYNVTVYSQKIPSYQEKQNSKLIASQLSPCLWFPEGNDFTDDLLRHQLISKLSYQSYRQSLKLKRYRSLSQISVYEMGRSIQQLKQIVSDLVFDNFKNSKLDYGTGQQEEIVQYQTILIDTFLLLEQLKTQVILRGGKFVQRKFTQIKQVLELKENIIANCIGYGSALLFDDKNIYPVRATVVELTHKSLQKTKQNSNWFLKVNNQKGDNFSICKHGNQLKIYTALQQNQPNSQYNNEYVSKSLSQVNTFISLRKTTQSKL